MLPDYAELELRVADEARCPALVCFDGKETRELQVCSGCSQLAWNCRVPAYVMPALSYCLSHTMIAC